MFNILFAKHNGEHSPHRPIPAFNVPNRIGKPLACLRYRIYHVGETDKPQLSISPNQSSFAVQFRFMTIAKAYTNNKDIIFLLSFPLIIWLMRPLNSIIMTSKSSDSQVLQAISSFMTSSILMYVCAIMSLTAFVFALLKTPHDSSRTEKHLRAVFLIAAFMLCLLSLFALL